MSQGLSLEKVVASPTLPSLPAVALQVLELTRDEAVKLQDIARVVQNDQALSAKILKTVNSTFYGLSRPCPTVARALTYLGLNTVKSLVLGFSLVDWMSSENDGLDLQDYWRRSVFSAAAARRIGLTTRCCDPDEAFMAALMQDVGMPAIYDAAPEQYHQVIAQIAENHADLEAKEKEAFGFTHADAGAALARKWRLPAQIIEPIRFHHRPDDADDAHQCLVRAVALSFLIASALTAADPTDALATVAESSLAWFGMKQSGVDEMVAQIAREAGELSSLFRVNIGKPADVDSILAEARERSMEHQIKTQIEAEALRQSNQQLARQAVTDGLTGLANRKRFDSVLIHEMQQADATGGCVGLIFIDADRFKNVNDTYGHQVGDAVLMEFAHRLQEIVGDDGLVARYGGEEFAIIVPHGDRKRTTTIAERIRRNVEASPVEVGHLDCGVQAVSVTASFGVAAREPASAAVFSTGELLIQAADKAVYRAKRDGRNCVRVYRPRTPAPPVAISPPAPTTTT